MALFRVGMKVVCRCEERPTLKDDELSFPHHLAVLKSIRPVWGGTEFALFHDGHGIIEVPARFCRPADALDVVVLTE